MQIKDQRGFAHVQMLVVGVLVFGAVGFAGYKVITANSTQDSVASQTSLESDQAMPVDLSSVLSVDQLKEIATEGTDATVTDVELDQEDTGLVFKVKLSDGTKLLIDAFSGEKLSNGEVEFENEDDTPLPSNFTLNISFEEARTKAQAKYPSSKLEKIELDVENGVVVYSVRFMDDARVDIDVATGEIVRTKDPKKTTSNTTTKSNDDSDDDGDDSRSSNSGSGSSNSGSGSRSGSSGSSSGSDDSSDDGEDDENEIRVEGTLFVSSGKYKVTDGGVTYTIDYSSDLSSLVGKPVRVDGVLGTGNVIDADEVRDRS